MAAVLLYCVIAYQSRQLQVKNEAYQKEEQILIQQIEEEQERTASLEEHGKYVQTKQYIEEMAREKLGLAYPNEIMLKPKE
jgi:cell division protein DivIC